MLIMPPVSNCYLNQTRVIRAQERGMSAKELLSSQRRMGTVHGIEHHVPHTVEVLITGAVAA
jgi:hypothetical protein